jgi:hypothetical protein
VISTAARSQQPFTKGPAGGNPPVDGERRGREKGKYDREELHMMRCTTSLGHGRHNPPPQRGDAKMPRDECRFFLGCLTWTLP